MAGSWAKTLAVAVLLMGAGAAGFTQSPQIEPAENDSTGALTGKLTDLYSRPLEGVAVVVRNQATGAEARTITTKNGVYRFSGLEPGEYTLTAESPQLGRGQVKWIAVAAGHEARVQVALEFALPPPGTELAAQPERKQPWLNRPILETEALPRSDAELATEPLQLLTLSGRRVSAEIPLTTTFQLNATLETEPLRMLALAGQNLPNTLPIKAASQESGPATPALSNPMSAAELQALPVSGRRWQDFVLDNTPTSTTPAGGQGEISLRGTDLPTEVAVDGINRGLAFGRTNEPGQGSSGRGPLGQGEYPAGMAQVGKGGHGIAVSEAAIRRVETVAGNVEAATDRAAGGRMNVETQHGANELHGQGFFFDRQNNWGAQNPFTQWVKETAPAVLTYNPSGPPLSVPVFTPESYTPLDRETVWGIGVGSRILRNKLFWFAALDGYNRNDAGVAMVKHPDTFFAQPSNSNDQMQVLSARLGLSIVNPVGEGYAAYSCMLETLGGTLGGSSSNCLSGSPLSPLLGPAPRTAQQWTGFGRLDWEAAERHRFTLEGIGARWNSPGGGLTRVSEAYGNHSFGSSKASEEWLLGRWEAFLTPNLLAVTQASAGRVIQEARPSTPSTYEKTLLGPNVWGQLPEIVVDNRYGFTIGNPSRFGQGSYPDEHLYHGQESLDWIRGKLLVKAGFEVSHNADTTSLLRNQTGTYNYSNVENFISDALAFQKFGISGELDPILQHTCDQTGRVWTDSLGNPRGQGSLPCYSYYSQVMGPSSWHLSTNDWAGYATAQWEASKRVVLSAGIRWEREQLPPPLAALQNPELPLTEKLPNLGNQWGPRVGLAVGSGEKHWPVLRLGYGMYFGRTGNLTVETALTQTGSTALTPAGSLAGDLNFFIRPTDGFNPPTGTSDAQPFPYVLRGPPGSVVKPGAVEFAPNFHNPEIHQAVAALEETLPSHVEVTASAMVSLGRRLPVFIDTNLGPALTKAGTITYAVVDPIRAVDPTKGGPIKATQISVPFYASSPSIGFVEWLNPDYQQIDQITSKANSTYEAAMLRVERYGRRGLSLRAHYVYSRAMDWNPGESELEPANFSQEYGTSDLNMRHSAGATVVYEAPWKLRGRAGKFANGWMLSGVGQFRSGLPYTMRTVGSLPECFISAGVTHCTISNTGQNATTGDLVMGLRAGMNGSGGDNRVYGVGNDNIVYNIGRNTYRYPATWKADLRLGRRYDLGHMRELELLAESFNLFNHQNVTELETTGYYIESGTPNSPPTLNFLTGLKANTTAFGQPLNINATNFYRERQIQFGLRLRF